MNKKLLSLSVAALVLASTNANAFYIGAGAGSSKVKSEGATLDGKASFVVSTGMSIPLPLIPIRGEVELMNLEAKEDNTKGKIYGAAANAYIGLPLLPIIKPYIGMGLSYTQLKISGSGISDKSDWKVAPQYMLGLDLSLPLIPVAGGVEYRYMDTKYDDTKVKSHTVMVKGRFTF